MMGVALVFAIAALMLGQSLGTTCKSRSCFDYVNECGKGYGGCVDMCGDTFSWPSFSKPPCPSTSTAQVTAAPALVFSSAARVGPPITRTTSGCNETICIDAVNDCGVWYGGCFPVCSGFPRPSPTPPPCLSSSSTFQPIIAAVTSISLPHLFPGTDCNEIVCLDYYNRCNIKYGGCFPACGGSTPIYSDPGCPLTVSSPDGGEIEPARSTVAGSQAARVTSAARISTLTALPPVTTLDLRWGVF